jgi:hypothetical protein
MKAIVSIWDDERKRVRHDFKLDVELRYKSDLSIVNYWFWVEGRCPYDGEKLTFNLVWDGELSKQLENEIDRISQDIETYTNREIEWFLAKISTLIKYYDDIPSETGKAGYCVHFAPTEYYEEEELKEMGVDIADILTVESGVATVDINDVVKELIDEMKG